MSIQVGDSIPSAELRIRKDGQTETFDAPGYFAGRRVVLFAVPGAFTPTCSAKHLPGFIQLADRILAAGVDAIACLSVNDAFVMQAWGEQAGAGPIDMIADGNADFARALGLESDSSPWGMGIRSRRFSMLVEDGVVSRLFIENPGEFRVSSAETMLAALGGAE